MSSPPLGPRTSPIRGAALAVRFLLELALLAGAAVLARQLIAGWWGWAAAIVAVVAVATLWGLFLSPKATVRLPKPAALALEAALFLGIGAGLFTVGLGVPAAVGVGLWMVDRIALALLPD